MARSSRGPNVLAWTTVALLTAPVAAHAQEPGSVVRADSRVEGLTYESPETGEQVPYALFVPSAYDEAMAWPLIVALHGLGRPYDWMMGYDGFIDRAEADGYLVVAPLGYHPRAWYGSRGHGVPQGAARGDEELPDNLGELSELDVMNVLGLVQDRFNIDDDRIYLWGHSMGGAGTYHLAARYPDIWAGLAVAAPAPLRDRIGDIESFRHIPTLVLHGDADATVPVELSRTWVARMRELGMEHLYVEVPGGDHSSFVNSDPEMISKVFSFFDITERGVRSR